MKRILVLLLAVCMVTAALSGCAKEPTGTPTKDVDLSFFTGKVETVDLLDEIIAAFNAQSGGITVEQEY